MGLLFIHVGWPSAGMGLAEGAHWRCTAGLEEISKGEMHIGGRLINDVPPKDRDIAMVFQSYALEHHMTVYREPPAGKPPAVFCVWGMKCRMLQARFVFHWLLSVRVIL